jgi:hypothetical protein
MNGFFTLGGQPALVDLVVLGAMSRMGMSLVVRYV